MTPRSRRARAATAGLALLAVATTPALQQLPAIAAGSTIAAATGDPADLLTTLGDTVAGLDDLTRPVDAQGKPLFVEPSTTQVAAAKQLGSGVEVRWNDSGTPASIAPQADLPWLAKPAGATPEAAARTYLLANADVLGISVDQIKALEVVGGGGQEMPDTKAEAVLFRQKFGDLVPATRGMVTVGVAADGSIAYVSSSLAKASGAAPAATLSALDGWLKAASNVGRTNFDASKVVTSTKLFNGWTQLTVPGFAQPQLARMRAYATSDGVVRPVVEANVVDVQGGSSMAYTVLVDAITGTVLFRQNAVENSNNAFPYQGTYTKTNCSMPQPFMIADNTTKTIAIVAAAAVAVDDITIKVTGPGNANLGTFDVGTSPESATLTPTAPATVFGQGTYNFQVCAFDANQIGGPYTATVVLSDTGAAAPTGTGGVVPKPTWRAFTANPSLSTIGQPNGFTPDNSVIECWTADTAGCAPGEAHENQFSFGAWDTVNGVPTLTTIGNNANTHEAWGSPLTPGGLAQAPYSPTRAYTQKFTDVWNNSKCNPANLTAGGNDINAVTTNLFVGHNRVHDFAYGLGFTERNYNLQLSNGDRGGMGGDQEIGNVQAGALVPAQDPTGGEIPVSGRDNANQIALQDGVPGITNQYLFQPIAGAFYSPCTDGALDTGIYGHEYTHAISNRMVGGPDSNLSSEQGGAMGESWSDLVAAEYQFENDYPTGTNPWSLGSYTTGNFAKGIRDYAINDNPLNYSDYGFDTTGFEVHADGEIWNGTLWEVRQALVNKWNAQFPYADKGLQARCEQPSADPTNNQLPASACPGNRRWVQLIFDAWLLQPAATDMLQARDAMLAADRMRFGGANQAEIASAFARRGMGAGASTPSPDSEDTKPSFRSAFGKNSDVTFTSASAGAVYVGNYEARATPIAFTKPGAGQSATTSFTPGIYRMTFVSPTSGFRRFVLTVQDNGVSFTQPIDDAAVNLAAAPAGAGLIAGATTAGARNAGSLIDGTESTNWAGVVADSVDVTSPGVAVDLAGGTSTISSAKVSALLHPAAATPNDPDAGSRFTALRKFALQACTTGCEDPKNYTTFFTSADDAFPADIPRPVAPDQTMRTFRFTPVQASAVRLVALENQCTGQVKYSGEQDNDPATTTDCKSTDRDTIVHAAELQVFGAAIPDDPAEAPAGDGSPGSGTAGQGTNALPLPGQASIGNAAAAAGPGKAKTKVRIRLPRVQQVKGKESTPMKYAVISRTASSNRAKVGVATVRLDGKRVKRSKMAVGPKQGSKVVGRIYKVPTGLSLGRHTLKVIFKSRDKTRFTSAKSRKIVITVVRTRPTAG